MIEEIYDAISMAQHDRRRLNNVVSLSKSVPKMEDDDVDQLVDRLADFHEELQRSQANTAEGAYSIDQCLQPVVDQLVIREQALRSEAEQTPWSAARLDCIHRLYVNCPSGSELRCHLLRLLATIGTEESLRQWSDMVCGNPPYHRLGMVLVFAPLMQPGFEPPEWLLDQLLNDATTHSQTAPAVYDLLNYYYRHRKVDVHPAAPRADALVGLLSQLIQQLGKIESGNLPANATPDSINQLISDSVALIVAICDSLALLQHKESITVLADALGLRHRRVQTEAAAALARLGIEQGKTALIALAKEPVARLRVLAYADELGFRDEISLELQGEISLAESHLAIWLAEPGQMGLAPSKTQLVETREMYWPGYEHPVQCFLFEYFYGLGESAHSNIAICGPMTHAFAADLKHLSPDELYAAFAGWQTVHQEIFQIAPERAETAYPNDWRRLVGDLHAEAYDEAEIKMAASFFGQLLLIAEATNEGKPGTAIIDTGSKSWFAAGNPEAPIDWSLAYAMWRGQQMLNSFNEQA
ncbi:HEAT repeat domain-containing protein [Mariniblastus sp.]|nr:HEAT repeat domain-containing protein [Mariniblastus sp.]